MSLIPLGILAASGAGGIQPGVAGYSAGGSTGAYVSTVDKFAFPSDSRTTLGTGLSSGRNRIAGMSNSRVAGYAAGGTTGSNVATVDKFAFPGDSRTTLGTGLSVSRSSLAGFQDGV